MHLGEYAWIIAFGDEILRCKISHHISRYATASPQGEGFGLCRPVKLRKKSERVGVTILPRNDTGSFPTQRCVTMLGFVRMQQTDKSEFDPMVGDKKQRNDKAMPGGAPGRTVLIRGEGIRDQRGLERINFSASPGRFFGYFLVDTRK